MIGSRRFSVIEERAFRAAFACVRAPESCALLTQLSHAEVALEEAGHLSIRVSNDAVPVMTVNDIWLAYEDEDGGPVNFGIILVDGYLAAVDRYRLDGDVLKKQIPTPSEIRVESVSLRE